MAILNALTVILGVAGAAAAAPKAEPYGEVIPGPGMPSLESLGLTSRDLYDMAPADSPLAKRDFPMCTPSDSPHKCRNVDAQACINYLKKKGNTPCGVHPRAVFCQSGSCQIQGYVAASVDGTKDASSPCSTVADVAQGIISSCASFQGKTMTEGSASPDNNQNLVVYITKP